MSDEVSWGVYLQPLVDEFQSWCEKNSYDFKEARELLFELGDEIVAICAMKGTSTARVRELQQDIRWLEDFIERWEAADAKQMELDGDV